MIFSFFQLPTYLLFIIIFSLIIGFNYLGHLTKKSQLKRFPGRIQENMGSIEGSMLGVMSLLLGFTFSVAVAKFELRRHLIVDEANIIGTAILRTDMYPDSIRVPMKAEFKEYLESRIRYYDAGIDEPTIKVELDKAQIISSRIWKTVTYYSNDVDFRIRSQQMIPVLNDMIDIVASRDAARANKVPPLILFTLLFLVLTASFLLGTDYRGHKRNIILLLGYALVMTLTINLISELNHPRQGLINLDATENKVLELRKLFS